MTGVTERGDGPRAGRPRAGRPGIPLLLIAITVLFSALPVTAQTVFGGSASFSTGITGDTTDPAGISPFVRLELAPELSVFADTSEFRATGWVRSEFPGSVGGALSASVDTLELRLFPAVWLSVDVGLQRHAPGAALVFSPINYLSPLSVEFPAGNGLPTTAGSAAMIGATVFVGQGFVAGYAVPAPAVPSFPAGSADLLDRVSILAAVDDPGGSGTLTRASLAVGTADRVSEPWRRASFSLEAGGGIGPMDVTAIYYHGLDRIPTVAGRIDTRSLPAGEFALTLAPAESVIDAVGASAQTAVGPATFWADASFVTGRTFGTTTLVPTATAGLYETETIVVPHTEIVVGGSVQTGTPDLQIAAEYRHGFLGTDRTDVVRLDFPGTAMLAVTAGLADGLLSLTAAGAAIIPDRSALLVASVAASPSSELSAFVQMPIVVAADGSLLGALRTRTAVTAGLTYRF